LFELLPWAFAGRMQENHKNEQEDSGIAETRESFTITRAALNNELAVDGATS